MKYKITFFLLFSFMAFCQDNTSILTLDKKLMENANSVIRNQVIEISVLSRKQMTVKISKTVTVLNERGLKNIDATEYYDKSRKINKIEAVIYNSLGSEIKKFKQKDFTDQSVADGFSMLTDNRILTLDYSPTSYPFTIVYNSEITTVNTAFMPTWYPIDDLYESVEQSSIIVKYNPELGFKYKENNCEGFNLEKVATETSLTYTLKNLPAEKSEDYAQAFSNRIPSVNFGLNYASLEGVEINTTSWEEYGKLWYKELVADDSSVSAETINDIAQLTKNVTQPLEKAKLIYQYVQNKTRYVSIQLGIGGFKPMLVKDVDRLGYGDCKALSNYTRVLLEHVGVQAYYTIIYGDRNKRDLKPDFVGIQGNHAILTLPVENANYFLECTSQTNPFAFGGNFTDDRFALMIKPDGAVIIKTNELKDSNNYQKTNGFYRVDEAGNLKGSIQIKSGGIQYDQKLYLDRLKEHNQITSQYKERFSTINNLNITKFNIANNANTIELVENVDLEASNYVTKANNSIYFTVNAFTANSSVPTRYRDRKSDFEISRGYIDTDEIEINLPKGFQIEYMPENNIIDSKFGKYEIQFEKTADHTIIYKRTLQLNKGNYDKSEYENFRTFNEQILKNDNLKVILTKTLE